MDASRECSHASARLALNVQELLCRLEEYLKFAAALARAQWMQFDVRLMLTGIAILLVSSGLQAVSLYSLVKQASSQPRVAAMLLAAACMLLHALSFFSDSFIVAEGWVVAFFIATLTIALVLYVCAHASSASAGTQPPLKSQLRASVCHKGWRSEGMYGSQMRVWAVLLGLAMLTCNWAMAVLGIIPRGSQDAMQGTAAVAGQQSWIASLLTVDHTSRGGHGAQLWLQSLMGLLPVPAVPLVLLYLIDSGSTPSRHPSSWSVSRLALLFTLKRSASAAAALSYVALGLAWAGEIHGMRALVEVGHGSLVLFMSLVEEFVRSHLFGSHIWPGQSGLADWVTMAMARLTDPRLLARLVFACSALAFICNACTKAPRHTHYSLGKISSAGCSVLRQSQGLHCDLKVDGPGESDCTAALPSKLVTACKDDPCRVCNISCSHQDQCFCRRNTNGPVQLYRAKPMRLLLAALAPAMLLLGRPSAMIMLVWVVQLSFLWSLLHLQAVTEPTAGQDRAEDGPHGSELATMTLATTLLVFYAQQLFYCSGHFSEFAGLQHVAGETLLQHAMPQMLLQCCRDIQFSKHGQLL